MRRREFITLFVGSATAWPLAARAQQGEQVRRIGMLWPFAANDPRGKASLAALQQALRQLGWIEGRNLPDRRPLVRRQSGRQSQKRS